MMLPSRYKLLAAVFFTMTAEHAYASWSTYHNETCGYSIQYPSDSKLTQPDPKIQDLYFPPTALIEDLVADRCTEKISLPIQADTNLDGKYVYVFKLKNFPAKLLDKAAKVNVENKQFYKLEHSETGMCHQSNYSYYFTKEDQKYYAILILFASHCIGVVDNQVNYDLLTESQDFKHIIASFKSYSQR